MMSDLSINAINEASNLLRSLVAGFFKRHART
jgi:hypothetical protein